MVTFDIIEAYNPYSITFFIRTPTYEWILKDKCSKEIRSCAQTMITILESIVNIIRINMFDQLMSMRMRMHKKFT
jgi:hypothetical protein